MEKEVEIPQAYVKKPRLIRYGGIDPGLRVGRGFSRGELEAVGLTIKDALRLRLPVDKRRRTVHEWNIRVLKDFLEKIGYKGRSRAG